MAAGRKLQAEIEKVLKKVEEGIEEFNNVWDNVHSAVHANQREKFEAELKTQIKKLQRDREQIKIWQSDKSVKDKNALAEARKKIEVEMERFKEFERDSKTKQYSKEGLSKSDKVDPHEEERGRHRAWIERNIDKLHVQIDEIDADIEAQSGKKSKGPKHDDAAMSHLRYVQETHRWHAIKLEQLLRKLDNDEVALDEFDDLRDTVEYYVDENSRARDEFQPFDTVYESFGLEDVEDYLTKDRDRSDSKEEQPEKDAESTGASSEKHAPSTEGSKSEGRREEEPAAKAPTKHTAGAAAKAAPSTASASPTVRANQRAARDEASEPLQQKPWPPMMSVWQNPPPTAVAAEKEKAAPPAAPGAPPKSGPPVPRPAPTLPPPMQPAPDRPPPPGQAPVLNAPPNQPPPKPAPHQMPQMQPPTQAPPQPPLPSPPLGSPPRPQGPNGAGLQSTLAGIVSAMPMPAPPPMPPPAPQDGPASSAAVATASAMSHPAPQAVGAAPPIASGSPSTMSEPPSTAPPPPPPPVLPPPPPSPAPAPSGPPSTTPVLPPGHAKTPPAGGADQEPPQWPPPVPSLPEEHLQQAPKVPPPSEAPPPPSESPPPPPLDVAPGPNVLPEATAPTAALESRAPTASASSSSTATLPASSFEPSSMMPPPPPALGSAPRPADALGLSAASEVRGMLSPRKLNALQLLSASHRHLPAQSDGRRNRKYAPRNPYVHVDTAGNPAYPMQPTQNYEDPAMFKKYDLDTLFFIFYYQQGSYQQHLAAKELKKLSWRYHTKYLTWFQRHEEPRMTASDFERGAYVYFDHDSGWCQRIKSDFTFEYQFLEDEPM